MWAQFARYFLFVQAYTNLCNFDDIMGRSQSRLILHSPLRGTVHARISMHLYGLSKPKNGPISGKVLARIFAFLCLPVHLSALWPFCTTRLWTTKSPETGGFGASADIGWNLTACSRHPFRTPLAKFRRPHLPFRLGYGTKPSRNCLSLSHLALQPVSSPAHRGKSSW